MNWYDWIVETALKIIGWIIAAVCVSAVVYLVVLVWAQVPVSDVDKWQLLVVGLLLYLAYQLGQARELLRVIVARLEPDDEDE